MTWAELIRRLKAAGFVEQRTGKGSSQEVRAPGHRQGDLGLDPHQEGRGTAERILRDAGLK